MQPKLGWQAPSHGGLGVLSEPTVSPRGSGPPGLKGMKLLLAHHEATDKFSGLFIKVLL